MGPCVSKNPKPVKQTKEQENSNIAPEKLQILKQESTVESKLKIPQKVEEKLNQIKVYQSIIQKEVQKYEEQAISFSQQNARYQVYIQLIHKEYLNGQLQKLIEAEQVINEIYNFQENEGIDDCLKQADDLLIDFKAHDEAKTLEKVHELSQSNKEVETHVKELFNIFKYILPLEYLEIINQRIEQLIGKLSQESLSLEDQKYVSFQNLQSQILLQSQEEEALLIVQGVIDRVGQKFTSLKKDNELSFFSSDQSPVKNETSQRLHNLNNQISSDQELQKIKIDITNLAAPKGDIEVEDNISTSENEDEINQDANPIGADVNIVLDQDLASFQENEKPQKVKGETVGEVAL